MIAYMVQTVMQSLCKAGHGSEGEPFVRCVQAAPEPMCILASTKSKLYRCFSFRSFRS